jgi:hypothetical protein
MKHLRIAAMVMAMCCVGWDVSAQDEDGSYRKGPVIGLAAGGSVMCDGCGHHSGLAFDWHIGWTVSRRVALLLDRVLITTGDYHYDLGENFTVDAVAVQYWPTDRVWVRAGIGLATYRMKYLGVRGASRTFDNKGLGATATAGVEFVRTRGRGVAIDAQVSFQTSSHAPDAGYGHVRFNRLAGQLGFNWYRRHQPHTGNDTGRRPTDSGQD